MVIGLNSFYNGEGVLKILFMHISHCVDTIVQQVSFPDLYKIIDESGACKTAFSKHLSN